MCEDMQHEVFTINHLKINITYIYEHSVRTAHRTKCVHYEDPLWKEKLTHLVEDIINILYGQNVGFLMYELAVRICTTAI
jgi:hypothetical protein